jgi:ubiquinone/menaquinone biosynthesis C-methylase UbiE
MIKWYGDKTSSLPLCKRSVDEAGIAFLFGEMRSNRKDDGSLQTAKKKYQTLLSDVKRVLKQGGTVEIADVKAHIGYIAELLEKEGFGILRPPERLNDENYSVWANIFFKVFRKSNRNEEDSVALPMHIKAIKVY